MAGLAVRLALAAVLAVAVLGGVAFGGAGTVARAQTPGADLIERFPLGDRTIEDQGAGAGAAGSPAAGSAPAAGSSAAARAVGGRPAEGDSDGVPLVLALLVGAAAALAIGAAVRQEVGWPRGRGRDLSRSFPTPSGRAGSAVRSGRAERVARAGGRGGCVVDLACLPVPMDARGGLWQLTAVDAVSGFAWAELTDPRGEEPSPAQVVEFVERIAAELVEDGTALEAVVVQPGGPHRRNLELAVALAGFPPRRALPGPRREPIAAERHRQIVGDHWDQVIGTAAPQRPEVLNRQLQMWLAIENEGRSSEPVAATRPRRRGPDPAPKANRAARW